MHAFKLYLIILTTLVHVVCHISTTKTNISSRELYLLFHIKLCFNSLKNKDFFVISLHLLITNEERM